MVKTVEGARESFVYCRLGKADKRECASEKRTFNKKIRKDKKQIESQKSLKAKGREKGKGKKKQW